MSAVEYRQGTEHGFAAAAPAGEPPAVILCDPKNARNVGAVLRLASCYGLSQVWITGQRVALEAPRTRKLISVAAKFRLPREERMREYDRVRIVRSERPFDAFPPGQTSFVCVEFTTAAIPLPQFVHPPYPVYVFGPEDGHVPKAARGLCHWHVVIPTAHCLNLATAVATVLYDRTAKHGETR